MAYLISFLIFIGSISLGSSTGFANEKHSCSANELARQDCRLYANGYNLRFLPKTIAWMDGTWHTIDNMPLNGQAVAWEKITFEMLNGWPLLQLWLWDNGESESESESASDSKGKGKGKSKSDGKGDEEKVEAKSKVEGETHVQSLHWYVNDPEKRTMHELFSGVVRKRRPEQIVSAADSETKPDSNPSARGNGNAGVGAVAPSSAKAKASLTPAKASLPNYLYDAPEEYWVHALKNGELQFKLRSEVKTLKRAQLEGGSVAQPAKAQKPESKP